jgi:hypothetical protein
VEDFVQLEVMGHQFVRVDFAGRDRLQEVLTLRFHPC